MARYHHTQIVHGTQRWNQILVLGIIVLSILAWRILPNIPAWSRPMPMTITTPVQAFATRSAIHTSNSTQQLLVPGSTPDVVPVFNVSGGHIQLTLQLPRLPGLLPHDTNQVHING